MAIVTLDSPALEVMTDLEKEKAITIGPTASIDTANRLMMASGVRLLLVTEPLDRVVGLITATDILGEKPMQAIAQAPGRTYSDVVVQNIMTTPPFSSGNATDLIKGGTMPPDNLDRVLSKQEVQHCPYECLSSVSTISGRRPLGHIVRSIGFTAPP